MRKISLLFFILLVSVSCRQEIKTEDVAKINGYWEIEKVILPDGKTKDYKINETIDYFEIKDDKGFRKKVMPQLDGKYIDNGHEEQITVLSKDGKTYLNYATEYAKWTEEIIEVADSSLVLKNKQNLEYHYKKPIPFSVK